MHKNYRYLSCQHSLKSTRCSRSCHDITLQINFVAHLSRNGRHQSSPFILYHYLSVDNIVISDTCKHALQFSSDTAHKCSEQNKKISINNSSSFNTERTRMNICHRLLASKVCRYKNDEYLTTTENEGRKQIEREMNKVKTIEKKAKLESCVRHLKGVCKENQGDEQNSQSVSRIWRCFESCSENNSKLNPQLENFTRGKGGC